LTGPFAALVGAAVLTATVAGSAPQVLFHIDDPRIAEASGIATGIASPGVVYVQNDSGDSARFFALDARTGQTLATYDVPGATNVDWEDLAVARDRRGVASIWIADIGDNDGVRGEIRVYRVDEPHVLPGGPATTSSTTAPQIWRLRYPGGPVDAESLAVAPGGAAYIVTKSIFGASQAFALPAQPDPARVQVLRSIGEIDFHPTGTPGGPNIVGQVTATGAALSHDGSILAVRTYTDAYLWPVRGADVAGALHARPVRIALPQQPQGEGIAIDGNRLVVDSERVGSTVYAIALPRLAGPAATAPTAPARSTTAPTVPSGATAATAATGPPGATATGRSSDDHRPIVGAVVVAGGVAAVALTIGRRRARRRTR
jgi:hypothetical protein